MREADRTSGKGSVLRSLAVFCGSRRGADAAYAEAARGLGRRLAERGIELVYGGGGIGLMGVLAETVLAHGGRVTGVIPDFLVQREVGNPGVTDLVVVDSMHERKRHMFDAADAFVILPGGLGTLDEAIEIITWKQLTLHDKPIAVLDVGGYWAPLEALMRQVVAAEFAAPDVHDLFVVVDDVDALFASLDSGAPARAASPSRRF